MKKVETSMFLAAVVLCSFNAAADNLKLPHEKFSFFVTSSTHNGDLGGIEGADRICQRLAKDVGFNHRSWLAYLSTEDTKGIPGINARDRVGLGPWYNFNGIKIANSVADLHGDIQRDRNLINQSTALTETGDIIPGRVRDKGENNEHDILTGSDSHGRAFPAGLTRNNSLTCNNWTYAGSESRAMVGHHDRMSSWNTSWNSSHASNGCSLSNFNETGGSGRFYCFAK